MLLRALVILLVFMIPLQAQADQYVVRAGDTLGSIAQRYHIPISQLARFNGITNINLIPIGRLLTIPRPAHFYYYRVHWGDTLIGIGFHSHLSVATIRSMNPTLGSYLLAGQWLRLCGPCGGTGGVASSAVPVGGSYGSSAGSGSIYVVQPGDTLTAIASRYGVFVSSLMSANRITDANHVVIGTRLSIPARAASVGSYNTVQARSLITSYAQMYGLEPAFPLAVGWQESGFNESALSRTGAVGVMQVEPYTATHISSLTGRSFNLYNIDDNVHAGVYWLSQLVAYYGGNERLAAAAYYQGSRSLARHGFYRDTVQYVNNVMSLKASFGG